jgi:hypothetical protein
VGVSRRGGLRTHSFFLSTQSMHAAVAADCGEYRQAAGANSATALSRDSALAFPSMDAVRAEAGIAYLAGNYCRARARCPCIVGMS